MRFSILLPGAQGKQPGGNPLAPDMFDYRASTTFNYFSELNPKRRALIDALQAQVKAGDTDALETLFGVKSDGLEEATRAIREIYGSPLMAAIDRYSPGVMYRAMDFPELPTGAQRRLLENGIIFSGLFGLLRPDDLIPTYRLRMDATVEDIGKVSAYWKEALSHELNRVVEEKAVWNLLSGAYEAAWEDDASYHRMMRPMFYREEKGTLKPVTHGVKELRGALVHFIVTEMADSFEDLEQWEAPGGYELEWEHSEIDENGSGTAAMISRPGWEKRREERRKAKAAEEAAREAEQEPENGDEEEEEDDE